MAESRNKTTVLVADDDEANRDLLSGLLTGEGYYVICTRDGEGALRAVRDEPIDLALLDVMMPGKTGLSACLAIKSQPATRLIPVVLVTGLTSTDDRIQGIMCGADDFLSKPVNKHELLARVHSLLRLKECWDRFRVAIRELIGSVNGTRYSGSIRDTLTSRRNAEATCSGRPVKNGGGSLIGFFSSTGPS
jgi:DNA-binding response OmpR family regulator